MSLEDVDVGVFEEVLDMWCGKEGREDKQLHDAIETASVADRLQMVEVVAALEDTIVREMTVGTCAEALMGGRRVGLTRVEAAAWEMAVVRFEEVSGTAGFMELDETTVGCLL